VRKSLRRELRRIHDATGVTTIFVTHDQEEALELADRVAILNKGRIEQVGTPDQVHDHPASAFVCGFVGEANRFEGVVEDGVFKAGPISLPAKDAPAGAAVAFVRPYDLTLVGDGAGFEVHVDRIVAQGPIGHIEGVATDGHRIEAAISREDLADVHPGITLRLAARESHLFPATEA